MFTRVEVEKWSFLLGISGESRVNLSPPPINEKTIGSNWFSSSVPKGVSWDWIKGKRTLLCFADEKNSGNFSDRMQVKKVKNVDSIQHALQFSSLQWRWEVPWDGSARGPAHSLTVEAKTSARMSSQRTTQGADLLCQAVSGNGRHRGPGHTAEASGKMHWTWLDVEM